VLVCTRTRLDKKSVFLQRGQVFRKEGEKRRRKTGKASGAGEVALEPPQGGRKLGRCRTATTIDGQGKSVRGSLPQNETLRSGTICVSVIYPCDKLILLQISIQSFLYKVHRTLCSAVYWGMVSAMQ
jgi:hypothetical protein